MSFTFGGCGGSKIVRTVQDDNIFYSSSRPEIRIKINPDFKLVDEKTTAGQESSDLSGEKTTGEKTNKYFFTDLISGKSRAVSITISELTNPGWYYKSKIFNVKNELDSGSINIQGKRYQYSVHTVAGANYDLLARAIGRISGYDDNIMIKIVYLEQVTGDWSNIYLLTADQQRQLIEFVEDSKKDIQILE